MKLKSRLCAWGTILVGLVSYVGCGVQPRDVVTPTPVPTSTPTTQVIETPLPRANLFGVVRDLENRVVVGAEVKAYEYSDGNIENTYRDVTDENGFDIDVPIGEYDVIASKDGQKGRITDLQINEVSTREGEEVVLQDTATVQGTINIPGITRQAEEFLVYILEGEGQLMVTRDTYSFSNLAVGLTEPDSTYLIGLNPLSTGVFNNPESVEFVANKDNPTDINFDLEYILHTLRIPLNDSTTQNIMNYPGALLMIGDLNENTYNSFLRFSLLDKPLTKVDLVAKPHQDRPFTLPLETEIYRTTVNSYDDVSYGNETPDLSDFLTRYTFDGLGWRINLDALIQNQGQVVDLGITPYNEGFLQLGGKNIITGDESYLEVEYHE